MPSATGNNRLRLAVSTGGGDAPGLNAVIRAIVCSATNRGWEVYGISRGYEGFLDTDGIVRLTPERVRGITHLGGTIIGTTNKGNPFSYPVGRPDGTTELQDVSDRIVETFNAFSFDALIAIGGDGSLEIAHGLGQKGLPVIGVPKTIDNDLTGTVVTFGFDTAVTTATEAIDKLHSTAEAHERVMVVEVMGRYAGWIALNSGLSGTADVILIPEIPFDIDLVCKKIMDRELRGSRFSIVVVAEGALPKGGERSLIGEAEPGHSERVGGIAEKVAAQIKARTKKDVRSLVLGHLQRGGSPTTFDRLVSLRFGAAAVRMAGKGEFGRLVVLDPPTVKSIPIEDAVHRTKTVPMDCDSLQTARDLGVCLGD